MKRLILAASLFALPCATLAQTTAVVGTNAGMGATFLNNSGITTLAANSTYCVGISGVASPGSACTVVGNIPSNVVAWKNLTGRTLTLTGFNCGIYIGGTKDSGAVVNTTCEVFDVTTNTVFADTAVSISAQASAQSTAITNANDSISAGDTLVIKLITPAAWTTASPTTVSIVANIFAQ